MLIHSKWVEMGANKTIRNHFILLIIIALCASETVHAQGQPDHEIAFDRLMQKADSLTLAGHYDEAYHKYNAAKIASPNRSDIADDGIAKMLNRINAERATADSLEYLYKLRSEQLQQINTHLGFLGGRAWVYNDSVRCFALINEKGEQLTTFRFTDPMPFSNDKKSEQYAATPAKEHGRWVLVSRQGKIISEPYDWRIETAQGDYWVLIEKQWFIYNNKFKQKMGPFLQIDDEGKVLWVQNTDGGWGLMEKGSYRWLTKNQYDQVTFFEEGIAKVQQNEGWGCINEAGKEVVPLRYQEVGNFKDGNYTYYKKNDLFGILRVDGKEISAAQWASLSKFSEGLAAYKTTDGKWGIVDTLGHERVKPKFIMLGHFQEGRAIAAADENKWGVIDTSGNWIFGRKYAQVGTESYRDSLLWIKDNKSGKWGAINRTGDEQIEPIYDNYRPFERGTAWVQYNAKWGMIDKKGNYRIECKYEDFKTNGTGWTAVQRTGLWGFVDNTGKEVIAPKYHQAQAFSNNMAAVKLHNVAGYINTDNLWLLRHNLVRSQSFAENVAWASQMTDKGELFGLLSSRGEWLLLPQFDAVENFENGRAWVSKAGSSFFVNKLGLMVE